MRDNIHMYKKIVGFIKSLYGTDKFIPLHEPQFIGNEKKFLIECLDSTFVSSVSAFVTRFEDMICKYTGAKYAVATVNGTAALHTVLLLAGVEPDDEVITQPLTFVATANAIAYTGATPVFVDVDQQTLGLSAEELRIFLSGNASVEDDGFCHDKKTGRKIKACVPMHTFGHPVKIDRIKEICDEFRIKLIEDAAESFGSRFKGNHTGTFGEMGVLSFNGNKIVTGGGGGAIITNSHEIAAKARHLTTTARVEHQWEFIHDLTGYNYRLPGVNAALACAQMENIEKFLASKRETASLYKEFFLDLDVDYFSEPEDCYSNYWLNTIIFRSRKERDGFLDYSNRNNVMARPVWHLVNKFDMYNRCPAGELKTAEWLEDRIANIPSSVRI